MKKYRSLIIGLGEVGSALFRVLNEQDEVFGRDLKGSTDFTKIDVMHVCIPYTNDFVKTVLSYREEYNPKLVIVYSSTPIGTCEEIGLDIVHSPIEGQHPNLEPAIGIFNRWLGCIDHDALQKASDYWTRFGDVTEVSSSRFTEFLKLRSTSKYGINIAWTDYEKSVTKSIGMDFETVQEYDRDYNDLYQELGDYDNQRYILYPPNGVIGGHCVVPNAEILNEQFPSPFLDQIIRLKEK